MPVSLNLGTENQQRLLVAFRRTGLGDEALARFLGVDRTLIAHWRRGDREMPAEAVFLLIEFSGDKAGPLLDAVNESAAPTRAHGPVAAEAADVVRQGAEVTARLLVALADGSVDAGEASALLPDVERLADEVAELREGLAAACRPRAVERGAR